MSENDVSATLSEQCRHQVRIIRKRMAWIPWLFVIGFCFSILGLIPFIASFRDRGSPWGKVIFLAWPTRVSTSAWCCGFYKKDNMQGVCTLENRQGSFW